MELKAAIFDMDGVVTDTASTHCAAWKATFDEFLEKNAKEKGLVFSPFTEDDYLKYVDGKPREDGIQSFLASRSISIPLGDPTDQGAQGTIHGLGNQKNDMFNRILEKEGVKIFDSTLKLIEILHQQNIKVGIVTSSKNCEPILKRANLKKHFGAQVDGQTRQEVGLGGKPAPDMFLEAAKRLNVEPENTMVIEDAISGVEAGYRGGFGLVIGIDRSGTMSNELKEAHADIVVRDLQELPLDKIKEKFKTKTQTDVKRALENKESIKKDFRNKKIVVFLDYDGTLTPIVERPELAVLSDEMKTCLERLSERYTTAIISGRMLSNIKEMIGIPGLFYAGNHGFEIDGPSHFQMSYEHGKDYTNAVDQAFQLISKQVGSIKGILIEHKHFSITVHYRLVDKKQVSEIEKVVDEVIKKIPVLCKQHNKKVFEVQPAIDWDKGKALSWILNALSLDKKDVFPIYIGDDQTDENVFEAIHDHGLGLLVSDQVASTKAHYYLTNTDEVKEFLEWIIGL